MAAGRASASASTLTTDSRSRTPKRRRKHAEPETEEEAEQQQQQRRNNHGKPETEEDELDEILAAEDFVALTDTRIALDMMHAQFHVSNSKAKANNAIANGRSTSVKPLVLKSQIYSSVKDRTQVDREVEDLRRDGVIRVFKLNTGQDDQAIMFMRDYVSQIEAVKARFVDKDVDHVQVFDWFKDLVLPMHSHVGISHFHLCELLSAEGGRLQDRHVTLLINGGFLIRQLGDSDSYWFSIPGVGFLLKSISQGRKELISFLNRRKYKQILLSLLEKKRLQYSQLNMKFHIRDLIGLGHIEIRQCPSGSLVQLIK